MRNRSGLLAPLLFLVLMLSGEVARGADVACTEDLFGNVVMLTTKVGETLQQGAGVTFSLSQRGVYIVTANHLVRRGPDEASDIKVNLHWLPGEFRRAKLLAHKDKTLDIAVLFVRLTERELAERTTDGSLCNTATGASIPCPPGYPGDEAEGESEICMLEYDSDEVPRPGQRVRSCGFAEGEAWFSNIEPDRVHRVEYPFILFRSSQISQRGQSGGPLFSTDNYTDGTIWFSEYIIGIVTEDSPPSLKATSIVAVVKKLKSWGYRVQFEDWGWESD